MDLRDRSSLDPAGRPLVIGHRGAARVAPENTSRRACGCRRGRCRPGRVRPRRGGDEASLVIGHPGIATAGAPLRLDDALAFLAAQAVGIERRPQVGRRRSGGRGGARARTGSPGARSSARPGPARCGALAARAHPTLTRAICYPRDRLRRRPGHPWPGSLVRASAAAVRAAMPLAAPLLLTARPRRRSRSITRSCRLGRSASRTARSCRDRLDGERPGPGRAARARPGRRDRLR